MTQELIIRRAGVSDAAELAALEQICFRDPWTEESIRHDLEFGELLTTIVAVTDRRIIGYISVQILLDECDIRRVAVLPERRGMQVASILMSALIHFVETQGVKMMTLEVREDNNPARGLYEKFGFRENGRRPNYYGPAEDAVLMARIGDPDEVDPARQA